MSSPTTLQSRLTFAASLAVKIERESSAALKVPVPPECILAVWAVESEWGGKPCSNGYFGVKWTPGALQVVKTTHETVTAEWLANWNRDNPEHPARVVETLPDGMLSVLVDLLFADYPDEEASMRAFCQLISEADEYKSAWAAYESNRNLDALLTGIAEVYATGEGYLQLILEIAHQANVCQAIVAARGSLIQLS